MKAWALLISMFLTPTAFAATTFYYVGEAVTTDSIGVKVKTPYLVTRTINTEENTLIEVATFQQNGKFKDAESTMTIDGSNFTVVAGEASGKGFLIGPKWRWTYLEGEFIVDTLAFQLRIKDYNFFVYPQSITAHKEFFVTKPSDNIERLVSQEDLNLHQTDEATYLMNRQKLLGHL